MSADRSFAQVNFANQRQVDWLLPPATLKAKPGSLLPTVRRGGSGYPSPPMSRSPTPSALPPPELPLSAASEPTTNAPVTTAPALSLAYSQPAQPTMTTFAPPPPPPPPRLGYLSYPTQFPPQPYGAYGVPAPSPTILQGSGSLTSGSIALAAPGASDLSPVRSGRKSKAHVASACVNCKRAHLSCDVQRPCARCVSSGKQETCFDVQHKKRGRPRLREEAEFKVGNTIPDPAPQGAISALAGPTDPRPIAGTRHHRTDSLRSLRSQTSDSSSASALPTPGFPPPLAPQISFSLQQPPPAAAELSAAEIPTAYLNLDFVLIRANLPFTQIISGGQEMIGRPLLDFTTPTDGDSFNAIRTRLREEREAREPAYMPPILQAGQDSLQGVSESDVDRLSQGFADHTYTWTRSQPAASAETFPARIRLARAAIYFVVVTLPSFRPVVRPRFPLSPSPFAIPTALPTLVGSFSQPQGGTQSAPPFVHQLPALPGGYPAPERLSSGLATGSRTYQPYLPQQAFSLQQQTVLATTPRLLSAEPRGGATAFTTPPYIPSEAVRTSEGLVQLPPLGGSSAGSVGPSRAYEAESRDERERSSEDEDEGGTLRSPRKRRKVGIHDVIER